MEINKEALIKSLKLGFIVSFVYEVLIPGVFYIGCRLFGKQIQIYFCSLKLGAQKCQELLQKSVQDSLQQKLNEMTCTYYVLPYLGIFWFFIFLLLFSGLIYLYYNRKAKQTTI